MVVKQVPLHRRAHVKYLPIVLALAHPAQSYMAWAAYVKNRPQTPPPYLSATTAIRRSLEIHRVKNPPHQPIATQHLPHSNQ